MRIQNLFFKAAIILLGSAVSFCTCKKQDDHRKEISLNGVWKITKTDSIHTVP